MEQQRVPMTPHDDRVEADPSSSSFPPSSADVAAVRTYRGVSYDPATDMWRARIYCLGKHVTLGRYKTSSEAAFVHDRAAVFIHGDTAQTNHGVEPARRSNEREPPSSSWRIMATLATLARRSRVRRLAAESGDISRGVVARQSAVPRALALAAAATTMRWMDDEAAVAAATAAANAATEVLLRERATAAAAVAAVAVRGRATAAMMWLPHLCAPSEVPPSGANQSLTGKTNNDNNNNNDDDDNEDICFSKARVCRRRSKITAMVRTLIAIIARM